MGTLFIPLQLKLTATFNASKENKLLLDYFSFKYNVKQYSSNTIIFWAVVNL